MSMRLQELSPLVWVHLERLDRTSVYIQLLLLYGALNELHFDYYCRVWDGLNNKLADKLQKKLQIDKIVPLE